MPKLHPLDRLAMEEYADGLSGIPAGPRLTARQSLCLSGLPREIHDEELDRLMRAMWTNELYWREHGMNPPAEPYPGIAAIRASTLV